MAEDRISKRIKELQSDTKFTFKLTEDIIASVYRIALNDVAKRLIQINSKDPDAAYKKEDKVYDSEKIVISGKEMNKRFGTKCATIDYDELQKYLFKAKQETYREILNYITKKNDLMDVYVYVKEMAKKTEYDEIKIV